MVSSTPSTPPPVFRRRQAHVKTGSKQRPRLAAVDVNASPGDQRRLRRSQKDHNGRHLFGASEAAEGKIVLKKASDLLRILLLTSFPGATWEQDRARGHRV